MKFLSSREIIFFSVYSGRQKCQAGCIKQNAVILRYNGKMEQQEIPNGFYRVSAKGLILDETRKKFAIVLEDNGLWELPGGGLHWGESPEECLKREILEEMGLTVTYVSPNPSYFLYGKNMKGKWSVNIVYEIKVKDLDFTPSEECQEIRFVSPEELETLNAFRTVKDLGIMFDSDKHR